MANRPDPVGMVKITFIESWAFSLLIADEMITFVVDYKNIKIEKNCKKKKKSDGLSTQDTNAAKIRCLFGLLLFCGLFHDTKLQANELWCSILSGKPIYRACFSLKHYKWFLCNITFHGSETISWSFLKY